MTAQDLKNSILQLAVQGKLVPQCKEDEPASELTRQIIERRNQVEKNHIKTLSSISEEEISFDIPESWIWLRLGDFCQVYNGNSINSTVKQEKYSQKCDGHCFIATKDVGFDHIIDYENGIYIPKEETNFKVANAGSILLCMEGGSAGKKIGVLDRDVCFGNKLCCFTLYIIDNLYLYYYLQSPVFFSSFFDSMTGLIGGVGSAKLKNLICPIPPLAEQERIVAKIEELMPLVEEYGKAEEQLTKLNAEFPDKLRKSILQQAVQGKLTERDPADEPASELLKRIKKEKEALMKSGKIKKEKPLPEITEDEKPFDIPDTWEWSNINSLFWVTKLAGFEYTKFFTKETISPDNEVHIVRAQHVKMNRFIENDNEAIPIDLSLQLERSALTTECLLMTFIGAGIGDTCIYNSAIRHHLAPNVAKIVPQTQGIYLPYYLIWLMSPAGQANVEAIKKSTAQPSLSMETIRSIQVAVPPLSEQKRIVKRVKELLALCDELK